MARQVEILGKVYKVVPDSEGADPERSGCLNCAFLWDEDCCGEGYRLGCAKGEGYHYISFDEADEIRNRDESLVNIGNPPIKLAEDFAREFNNQLPGTKYDKQKIQYSLIPPHALQEVARNLTAGLQKYKERDNWKKVPGAKQRYLDALYRHLEAHRRGELYDEESTAENMLHLSAVVVNALFLMEFILDKNLEEVKE